MSSKVSMAAGLATAAMCMWLSGCSGGPSFPTVEPSTAAAPEGALTGSGVLKGTLHGGQQPITGARIYLYAAGKSGYGSASISLLTSASDPGYPAQQDANNNWYVTTDSHGFFQIVDTCTPGQQVYIASVGGNPGAGANSAANEIAVLGNCPGAGNFDSTLSNVFISEISTAAAAYATAAFAKDTFDIGAPNTTAAQMGISNAFANAANLFDVQNINDTARTSTVSGNGTVPQSKIHTIANILAACINSIGPGSIACSTLLGKATTDGTASGKPAADVTNAAMNMARNPSANVATLFGLQTSTTPFYPQLSSSPNDLSVSLSFANGALGNDPSLAIDGSGNVWTLSPGQAAVSKLSAMGAVVSPAAGYAVSGSFANGRGLAFDTGNNLWVLGQATPLLLPAPIFGELSDGGAYENSITQDSLFTTFPPTNATNLVIDGSGNLYYSSLYTTIFGTASTCCTVKMNPGTNSYTYLDNGNASPGTNFVAVSSAGEFVTGLSGTLSWISGSAKSVSGGGLTSAAGVALDAAGDVWAINTTSGSVSEFSSTGAALSGTSGYTGGLSTPKAIAIDGLGNAWVTNNGGSLSLSEFTSAGAVVGTGFSASGLANAGALTLDASGDAWVGSTSSTTITEFVGIAAPVITPTATAIGAGALGTRP